MNKICKIMFNKSGSPIDINQFSCQHVSREMIQIKRSLNQNVNISTIQNLYDGNIAGMSIWLQYAAKLHIYNLIETNMNKNYPIDTISSFINRFEY